MTARFMTGYAVRSLRRGGQRSVLAIVCIAFGVLALVAMQLLAHAVGRATNVEPQLAYGGDLLIHAASGALSPAQEALLAGMVRDGVLTGVTVFEGGPAGMLRSGGSGRVQFVGRAIGVDPATFPLLGEVRLSDGSAFRDAVAQPGSVVLSRDLARELAAQPGDTVRYGDITRETARLVVGGVAESIPDRRGQTMLYSLATASLLAGDGPSLRWAAATAVDDSAAAVHVATASSFGEGDALDVSRAVHERPDTMARVFGTMLRGAGLLGLIIGGIGIAYTLQVMLTRRRMEIATLRAIGYRTHHLVLLFGLEAGALGAIGGVIGAAIAVALSAQLVNLLDATAGALMLEHAVVPGLVAAGPLVGIVTAVLFGTAAIVRASAVRPGVLLRDLPVRPPRGAALGAIALNLLLALMFTVLAGIVMDSVLAGVGVVLVAAVGIVLLGAVLVALLWLVVRLPLPRLPLVNMARANLRSRQVRSAFSLIALFVGVFAIGFAAAAMSTGSARVAAKRGTDAGLNIRVYAGAGESAAIPAALRDQGADVIVAAHTAAVRATDSAGIRIPMMSQLEIYGDDAVPHVATVAGTWNGEEIAVLLPERTVGPPLPRQGEPLTVTLADRAVTARVAGFYSPVDTEFFSAPRGLIGGPGLARALGIAGPPTSYLAAIPERSLDAAAPALGERLPASLVVSRRDINNFLVATYRSLFLFVVAVAGLALVAGGVLIANAVSLAMVERRRELGVLMAVGYTSRRVLRTILLENGALGLVAGIAGIVAVRIVVAVLNARESSLDMEFGSGAALALLAVSVLLAMAAAGAVAWGPVHVRPLEVLRDE